MTLVFQNVKVIVLIDYNLISKTITRIIVNF